MAVQNSNSKKYAEPDESNDFGTTTQNRKDDENWDNIKTNDDPEKSKQPMSESNTPDTMGEKNKKDDENWDNIDADDSPEIRKEPLSGYQPETPGDTGAQITG